MVVKEEKEEEGFCGLLRCIQDISSPVLNGLSVGGTNEDFGGCLSHEPRPGGRGAGGVSLRVPAGVEVGLVAAGGTAWGGGRLPPPVGFGGVLGNFFTEGAIEIIGEIVF